MIRSKFFWVMFTILILVVFAITARADTVQNDATQHWVESFSRDTAECGPWTGTMDFPVGCGYAEWTSYAYGRATPGGITVNECDEGYHSRLQLVVYTDELDYEDWSAKLAIKIDGEWLLTDEAEANCGTQICFWRDISYWDEYAGEEIERYHVRMINNGTGPGVLPLKEAHITSECYYEY